MTESDAAPAYDPDTTPGEMHGMEVGPTPVEQGQHAPVGTHVPTQELYIDGDGNSVYRDKPLTTITNEEGA